jgi:choloylglycine hydrolase
MSKEKQITSVASTEFAPHSCSTFMLKDSDNLFIGHNLDDNVEVPGLIVVNKRDTLKENVSWAELLPKPFWSRSSKPVTPKTHWRSKYGSVTYNTNGKEFIDGGMNEAGLYVGEMNLRETQYSQRVDLPRIYHYQWMQYLLDNYASVEQVIASLDEITVDGHCTWHFFVGDHTGQVAIIEFLEGQPVVHVGGEVPVKVLCNARYASELSSLQAYQGFGGTEPVDFQDRSSDTRFVRGAALLQQYQSQPATSAHKYALRILGEIKDSNNKWGLLYDVKRFRLYFYTYKAPQMRYVDFSAFDLSANTPVVMLDIHQDLSGDVSQAFAPFDPAMNAQHMSWQALKKTRIRGWINLYFLLPIIIRRMTKYASSFKAGL